MQTVQINQQVFTFDDIKNKVLSINDEYLDYVLFFCKQWLNGAEEFTFNTSGSTGAPKATVASRKHMLASANATIKALSLTPNEHIFLCISAKMIGGAMMLVRALELGCDITIIQPTANPFDYLTNNHTYTFASFVPMQVYEVQTDGNIAEKLNRFTHILLGGAPANRATLAALSTLKTAVWQTYGMTETLSHIALKRVGVDEYYTALPGVKLKKDERNCLSIEAEVTDNQWLLTNDVVNLIDDTHFELLGRIDDVINSGGIKIFSYDVEHAIIQKMNELEMPPKPMFVCRKPDEKYGEAVVVIMLGEPLADDIIQAIITHCKNTLGKYAAPKHFYFVSEFEKLESGKLDKKSTLNKLLNKG
jgi:O-succinylbenzoic acid--CoA ligase